MNPHPHILSASVAILPTAAAQAQAFPTDVTLHEVLAEWGEGTSSAGNRGGIGAPAAANDATWLHTFSSGSLWAQAGGDFDPVASASLVLGGLGLLASRRRRR